MGHWFGLCLVVSWECNELVVVPILCVDVASVGIEWLLTLTVCVIATVIGDSGMYCILREAIADVGHTYTILEHSNYCWLLHSQIVLVV